MAPTRTRLLYCCFFICLVLVLVLGYGYAFAARPNYSNARGTRCVKDYKSQIVIEIIGKCTKTHKSTYAIVAYSFFIRVSCLVSRYPCLDFNTIIPYYMFLGIHYKYGLVGSRIDWITYGNKMGLTAVLRRNYSYFDTAKIPILTRSYFMLENVSYAPRWVVLMVRISRNQ